MGDGVKLSEFAIDLKPVAPSHVLLDGQELENVRSVTIHAGVSAPTTVTLELVQTTVSGRVAIWSCADGHEPIWFWCEACPLCALIAVAGEQAMMIDRLRERAALDEGMLHPEDLPTGRGTDVL